MPTTDEVMAAASRISFNIPAGHENDYHALLAKTDEACKVILAQQDYKPQPDVERFPRTNVHLPSGEENPLKGWAWRGEAGEPLSSTDKLLSGKTVVFKDTVCMADVPLLFGTNAFQGYVLVTRVLESGGRILGKAACESFSHGGTSSSSPYGPVENPYATGFSAGGSSSGCGALLGSGAADMGIGGDQGGSIRLPASLCGIVGLKPTFGLVPYTGVLSSEAAVDHVGPMAATVLDTARLLQAVAGDDEIDDRSAGAPLPREIPDYVSQLLAGGNSLEGLRIGVLKEVWESPLLAPAVSAAVNAAIDRLRALGAEVEEVSVPLMEIVPSLTHVLNKFGSGGTRQGRQVGRRGLYLNDYWDQLLPWTQEKYDKAKYFVTGTAMSCEYGWVKYPSAYGRAMNLARKLREDLDKVLAAVDVVIMPTVPQPARRHIVWESGPADWASNAPGITSFTGAFNISGHPAISVPVGFTAPMAEDVRSPDDVKLRLPVGMMIVGKWWDESTVFRVGYASEQSARWKDLVF